MLPVSHSRVPQRHRDGSGSSSPAHPPGIGICSNQAQLICHRRDGDGQLGVIAGDQSLSPNQLSPAWDHLSHRRLAGCPHRQRHPGGFARSGAAREAPIAAVGNCAARTRSRSPCDMSNLSTSARLSWRKHRQEHSCLIYIVNIFSFKSTPVAFPLLSHVVSVRKWLLRSPAPCTENLHRQSPPGLGTLGSCPAPQPLQDTRMSWGHKGRCSAPWRPPLLSRFQPAPIHPLHFGSSAAGSEHRGMRKHLRGLQTRRAAPNPNQNPNSGQQSSKGGCWSRAGAEREEKPEQEKGLGPQHCQNKEPIDTRPDTGTLPWHDGYTGSRAAGKL